MVVLAHISDLHLDGSERSAERATRVMQYLRGLPEPVDAVLVTGDIAHHGDPAEYLTAAEILRAPFPVLTCPGNHDVRPAYRTALLGEPAGDGPVNRCHHVGGAAILMCDSSVPSRGHGLLDPETLHWLAATLDDLGGQQPVLIAFHHTPVAVHHPLPDAEPLHHPEDLAALLADRPEVVALLVGHAHTAASTTFAGRSLLIAPAVVWTLRLPWEGTEFADRAQPPGLAFHVLDDDRRLTTHFRGVL
jgi:3',5'-cyclic AMP phosphodiesterase CpdA